MNLFTRQISRLSPLLLATLPAALLFLTDVSPAAAQGIRVSINGRQLGSYWEPPQPVAQDPRLAQVAEWYRIYLGREASQIELSRIDQELKRGTPLEAFKANMLGSEEFYRKTGGNQEYLNSMLRHTNNQSLTDEQQRRWARELRQTNDRTAFARRFINEFQPNPGAHHGVDPSRIALIDEWYHRYLGRHATDRELNMWARDMQQGKPLGIIHAAVLGSDEFFNRVARTEPQWVSAALQALGHQPTSRDVQYWLDRLYWSHGDRVAVAAEMLSAYNTFGERPSWVADRGPDHDHDHDHGQPNRPGQIPRPGQNPGAGSEWWQQPLKPTNGHFHSKEVVELVEGMGRRYLGRNFSEQEVDHRVHELEAGKSPGELVAELLASEEFYRRAGGDEDEFVDALFRVTGGVQPSEDQHDYWEDRFEDSRNRLPMVRRFLRLQ